VNFGARGVGAGPGYAWPVELLRWEERPVLRSPVLVAAFEGWNDAGDGASAAAAYLARRFGAERFASIDPEEFYDFTSTRPEVRLDEGMTRTIDWPENVFLAAPLGASGRDVVFLRGVEPQLRWRTFTGLVVEVAQAVGVELVVSLGALLAEVPHTRPVRVTGTAADRTLMQKLGLRPSRYEGPTGILGVLGEALHRAGIPSASLWATVPAYVGQTPSPKATLALVSHLSELLGVTVPTVDLDLAAAAYERQVNEVVSADEDATAYVRSLEEAEDDDDEGGGEDLDEMELPGGDTLAAEVERYLRDQGS
jgi:proteasome assembly chaperone (PAC2) family protein